MKKESFHFSITRKILLWGGRERERGRGRGRGGGEGEGEGEKKGIEENRIWWATGVLASRIRSLGSEKERFESRWITLRRFQDVE